MVEQKHGEVSEVQRTEADFTKVQRIISTLLLPLNLKKRARRTGTCDTGAGKARRLKMCLKASLLGTLLALAQGRPISSEAGTRRPEDRKPWVTLRNKARGFLLL